jgi:hypothetical protein
MEKWKYFTFFFKLFKKQNHCDIDRCWLKERGRGREGEREGKIYGVTQRW